MWLDRYSYVDEDTVDVAEDYEAAYFVGDFAAVAHSDDAANDHVTRMAGNSAGFGARSGRPHKAAS